MFKKFLTAVFVAVFTFSVAAANCSASFQKIYDETLGMRDLSQDEAASETFQINEGTLKLQIRKIRQNADSKKYHALVFLNDKRIFEDYFETVPGGYTFKVFKDTINNNLFIATSSMRRAWLAGYLPSSGEYVTYADSINYYNDFPAYPTFDVLKDGNVVLAFVSQNMQNPYFHAYRFTWDNSKNWFAYRDIGVINSSLSSMAQK